MSATLNLFDAPIVPGMVFADEFVSAAEEADLIAHIDGVDLSPFKFQQWTGKRLTRSFGWSYDFENGRFAPTEALPGWLEPVKARAARFAGLDPDDLVQALLIRYDLGAGIGWHKDRPVFEHVVGISLGADATLRLRRRSVAGFDRVEDLVDEFRPEPVFLVDHRGFGWGRGGDVLALAHSRFPSTEPGAALLLRP